MTPPLFAESPPDATRPMTAVAGEAESVCSTECTDWSIERPPYFSASFAPDAPGAAASRLQNLKCYDGCDPTGPRTRRLTERVELVPGHRLSLRRRFGSVCEGTEGAGGLKDLDQVYTDLYITEDQQERNMESMKRSPSGKLQVHDVARPLHPNDTPVRVVLTCGTTGVGKTFAVRKFTLDWCRALENQDVDLVVPLFFKELNLVRQKKLSLTELVQTFYPDLTDQNFSKTLFFILDGLDESRLGLDFNCELISDVSQKADVNALLVNLIRGELLPNAQIWITSRPAVANQIPARCVDRFTEICGFSTDEQIEEFFCRRFTEGRLRDTVLLHVRTSASLRCMCRMPMFSWITAAVMEHVLRAEGVTEKAPNCLTQLYAYFMLVLTQRLRRKFTQEMILPELTKADGEALLDLAKLAFEQLQKGSFLFYEEDLLEAGVDVTDCTSGSGVCTQMFKREGSFCDQPVYCFVHLSVQEFLAAVYLHHCFSERNVDVLQSFLQCDDAEEDDFDPNEYLVTFLHKALEKSFKSESGHLDLLVRFLHGLCVDSNRRPLHRLFGSERVTPGTVQRARNQLKSIKVHVTSYPDRGLNLPHCLEEMKDTSVAEEIEDILDSANGSTELSDIQCSALASKLQNSDHVLDELNLSQFNASRDGRLRLIPAIKNCKKVRISECLLSKTHYGVIVTALSSEGSVLTVLDLSGNWLQDEGLETLCRGLSSPNCKLETLSLAHCGLTMCSGRILAPVLEKSRLKELDLSRNRIRDKGVEMLSSALPQSGLHTLRLTACQLSGLSCSSLKSVLQSGSALKNLEVNENQLRDSGLDLLASGLESPQCGLEKLSLTHCEVTGESCTSLASALTSCSLTHLDLSCNLIQDQGLTVLCSGLHRSRLNTLRLRCCLLTAAGIPPLARALEDAPIEDLDLSLNRLRDVSALREALLGPHRLRSLRLNECGLTKEGCEALRAAQASNPRRLTELDLHLNNTNTCST